MNRSKAAGLIESGENIIRNDASDVKRIVQPCFIPAFSMVYFSGKLNKVRCPMRKILLFLLLLFWGCSSRVFTIRDAVIQPKENSTETKQLIEEGIRLHDAGDYKAAIQKYDNAIRLNPDNPEAYYEKSYSYMQMRKYNNGLNAALKAAEFNSDLLFLTYIQIGSCLDYLKRRKEALAAYQKAIDINPAHHLVYYNMAIVYLNLDEKMKALDCLKHAVTLNPKHASSHYMMGIIYQNDNYRIPALLAYCRFLALEPSSSRTGQALNAMQNTLNSGVQKKDSKNINIFISPDSKSYDGNFASAEIMLSFLSAAQIAEEDSVKQEPIEILVDELSSLFQMLQVTSEKEAQTGFVWQYYAPYFIELERQELVKPYVYYICQMADDPKIQEWIKTNGAEIERYKLWSDFYEFAKSL
ncbi:MAG: tetratricopeptide repeat protein [Candidatus Neomarinimicrobiota bacterium]